MGKKNKRSGPNNTGDEQIEEQVEVNQPEEAVKEPPEAPPSKTTETDTEIEAYRLLPRKSVVTLAGIKDEGEIITANELSGGKDRIQQLLKSGHIEKR